MDTNHLILFDAGILFIALLIILGAAELFTNGIEWLGQKLQLSESVIGSVLAAVGTAMPETLIPIVAVVMNKHFHQISLGAIAGAPFMLTTLTMSLCGLSVWIFSKAHKRDIKLTINTTIISRDLSFFIASYSIALLSVLASRPFRQFIACTLLLTYILYLKKTFAHEGEAGTPPEELHLERLLKLSGGNLGLVILQILAGLAGILLGATLFVQYTQSLSAIVHVPTIVLAFIIAPIATELPEKCASILWIRNRKDTLAFGNITGALVFQSCFPVAFGLAFTDWNLSCGTLTSGIVALLCAAYYLVLIKQNVLKYQHLLLGAVFYTGTVAWLVIFH